MGESARRAFLRAPQPKRVNGSFSFFHVQLRVLLTGVRENMSSVLFVSHFGGGTSTSYSKMRYKPYNEHQGVHLRPNRPNAFFHNFATTAKTRNSHDNDGSKPRNRRSVWQSLSPLHAMGRLPCLFHHYLGICCSGGELALRLKDDCSVSLCGILRDRGTIHRRPWYYLHETVLVGCRGKPIGFAMGSHPSPFSLCPHHPDSGLLLDMLSIFVQDNE
jgi:hypothetical protein